MPFEETEDRASITNHLALSVQPEQRTEEYINAHFDHHDNNNNNNIYSGNHTYKHMYIH